MKRKVKFFDTSLFKDFLYILSTAGVFFSFFSIIIDVSNKAKIFVGLALIIILFIIYLGMWIRANTLTSIELSVDNSKVIVKIGNIFNEPGLKVIAFNEYFDTKVDNEIISQNTLNGLYLNTIVPDIEELDRLIEQSEYLREKIESENATRVKGKKKRYRLGTIHQNDEYLLTAFSRFDNNNRAYLYMNDYISLLLNFWNEVDIIYAGRSVVLPLMGAGITRFKEYNNVTDQELLELLLWSFKISRIKFTHPSTVTIIIHSSRKDKINFYKLKGGSLMSYRNGTYVAFDGNATTDPSKGDMKYYGLLQRWNTSMDFELKFSDSHKKTYQVRDTSLTRTLQARLLERMRSSKNMLLIISKDTNWDRGMLNFEIERAVDVFNLPIIVAYPGYDFILNPSLLEDKWPRALYERIKDQTAKCIHISFKQKAIADAVSRFSIHNKIDQLTAPLHFFSESAYSDWGYRK